MGFLIVVGVATERERDLMVVGVAGEAKPLM